MTYIEVRFVKWVFCPLVKPSLDTIRNGCVSCTQVLTVHIRITVLKYTILDMVLGIVRHFTIESEWACTSPCAELVVCVDVHAFEVGHTIINWGICRLRLRSGSWLRFRLSVCLRNWLRRRFGGVSWLRCWLGCFLGC